MQFLFFFREQDDKTNGGAILHSFIKTLFFASYLFTSCNSAGTANNKNSNAPNSKNQIDSNQTTNIIKVSDLYGNWLRYDTGYTGRHTDINTLIKDTARLIEKHAKIAKQGCDGGCYYGYSFRRD